MFNDDGVFVHSTLESGYDYYVRDRWNRKYHFKIASFPVPPGITSEAIEVKPDNASGYEFRILSDFDSDIDQTEEKLKEIIRKRINQRTLKYRNRKWEIEQYKTVEGRIEYNEDFSRSEYDKLLVVDGKEFTIEQFIKMLEPYEGWRFQFRIIDSYERID